MADSKFMGTFDNENEVLKKIEELKGQGTSEEDMYVLSRNENQVSIIRGQTDIDYTSADGNWKDKFKELLSGSESVRNALSDMGMDKEETDSYYQEVEDGRILLFVDSELGASSQGKGFNAAAYGDPMDNTKNVPVQHGLAADIDGENFADGNDGHQALTAGNKENADTGSNSGPTVDNVTSTGRNAEDMSAPHDDLNDIAATGRNRRDVPMMERKVDDVPANDPNINDIPAGSNRTDDVRIGSPNVDDIASIDNTIDEIPSDNPNMTDVPPADEKVNDVAAADRSLDRLSDTESPEEWPQSAADRVRLNEEKNRNTEGENKKS